MLDESQQFSPQRVADRQEIQHRIYQAMRGIDRKDFESARHAFHEDATDNHGAYQGAVDGLFEWIRERHASLPFSYHMVGNILIEFANEDEAFAETYVLTWQSVTPDTNILGSKGAGTFEVLAAGRFVDHFTRRGEVWRIQTRVTVPESTFVVPEPEGGKWPQPPKFVSATRDDTDPAQVLRAQLGLVT